MIVVVWCCISNFLFIWQEAVNKCGLDPAQIQEVYMGNVCQAGEGQAPARQAALFAGWIELKLKHKI